MAPSSSRRRGRFRGKKPATPESLQLQQLVASIRQNDAAAFTALLQTPELDVNCRAADGDVALVEACRFARLQMATELLQRQANVNLTSSNRRANRGGLSPLLAACMALQPKLVELLLAGEQKVNLLQVFGKVNAATVCLLFCTANRRTDEQNELGLENLEKILRYAQQQGQLEQVRDAKPDKVNALLHVAAGLGNWKALQMLREHEEFAVNFQARNAREHSALMVVEMNSFQARSLQFCEPPRSETTVARRQNKSRRDRNNRKKQQQKEQDADKEDGQEDVKEETVREEVPCEADKQTFTRSHPDRAVEIVHVTRTVMELAKSIGVGAILSRKGDECLRGLFIKSLVLAEVGIVPILNEIAGMPDTQKEKAVYLDGLMYTVAAVYPLSVSNLLEYQSLWRRALGIDKQSGPKVPESTQGHGDDEQKMSVPDNRQQALLSHEAFKMILNGMLSYSSLSKRVTAWTLVLMHLLAPYASGSPLPGDERPVMEECGQLQFFERITEMLYRSGAKLAFCIFDRTDIEDDESFDEEIEFHLLIAFFELFLQFFAPYARTIRDKDGKVVGIAESFQRSIKPIKQLWHLVNAALSSLDDAISTPQRFSLLLHLLQVFEQVEAAFVVDEDATLTKLFAIMKRFVEQEAKKKRIRTSVVEQTHLLHRISTSFPMPESFTDKVQPLKNSVDVLIRSDPKVLGMDLYSFASIPGLIRLEHKVDYLAMLAEERNGSVSVSISRASGANYVDFILQQVLSASANNLKGEVNITLVNEPGVGVGVTREFFQIVQRCFFRPDSTGHLQARGSLVQPAEHIREIGSQWLELARSQKSHRNGMKRGDNDRNGRGKRHRRAHDGGFAELFPLFDFVDKQKRGVLAIASRPAYVSKQVIDAKHSQKSLSLTQKDLLVDVGEVDALKKVYLCIGRLIGLSIRHHQPLGADFPLVFWKFMVRDNTLSWEDYCETSDVFKRSLQFVLDHDFEAESLDMRFEYTMDIVVVVDDATGTNSESAKQKEQPEGPSDEAVGEHSATASTSISPTTTSMEMELKAGMGHVEVTNANKSQYVLLRAQQYFFGNEFEYYKRLRDGFQHTIARSDLKLFHPSELRRLVRGERTIDFEGLKKSVLYSRGASPSRGVIQHFWEVVDDFDQETRAKLLTFWSGSPSPPIFGFDSKYRSMNADTACWYIDVDARMQVNLCPMANTCDRRLILPEYPTSAALKDKLLVALEYGCVGYDRM